MLFMFVLLIPTEKSTVNSQRNENSLEIGKRYQLNVPMNSALPNNKTISTANSTNSATEQITQVKTEPQLTWQTAKVRNGDSLAKIFKRLGFSSRTTHDVSVAKGKKSKLLTKLNIGDKLHIGSNKQGQLVELNYPLSKTETLHVQLIGDSYQSYTETKKVEIREAFVQGVIKSSFWNAAAGAGMSDNQIINLANIFGWDIDFALDIREGDSFHIIYEKRYIEGEYIESGKILAAEFINQNEEFQAIRFSDGEYYSPDGNSMRKAFLRAPVNFKYISSNFKRKRFHPIQKRWKSHNGTDYKAKKGTPVVAAGNGKVMKSTYNKHNGNYVFLQHGNGILTKYLHFSKRAVKKGQRVKQGQIIGYVGSTGLSQAPHLHYEFLLNGVPRNPRTVKLPDAQPIAKKFRQEFFEVASTRTQELSSFKRTFLTADNTFIPSE
ncbi:MAG: peptidoglycan DD-metalloendopeptidase family protein [Alteromonadaceae bacterium]|nr:peptidoglycan DD-metalloendopeptidase family protein [Alteromonadaceae bacterium]